MAVNMDFFSCFLSKYVLKYCSPKKTQPQKIKAEHEISL